MKTAVLGVKVDDITMDQAVSLVADWLKNPGKHYIVTPNPEIITAAQKDAEFKKILNSADLSIPDGVGLKLSGKVKNTVTGTDLMEKLVALAADYGFTAGFLGGRGNVAKKCAECLKRKYPNLKVSFADSGGEVSEQGKLLKSLRLPKCDLIFVAFGHIKQEKWIAQNLKNTPAHVLMGVGGAFDYLSGRLPRSPGWLRKLGWEWLFRLWVQPWRVKRQFALIKYLFALLHQG